jgi:hypothetical protein
MSSQILTPDGPDFELSREDMIKYLAAKDELERRKRASPLSFFSPHNKQNEFFELLKKLRGAIFSGGNRVGKTVMNAVVTISHVYGYRIHEVPDLRLTADGDYPHRSEIPPRYWIRRPDGVPLRDRTTGILVSGLSLVKGVGNIVWPELQTWLPSGLLQKLQVTRGAFGVPIKLTHPDYGHVLHLGSVEQGHMAFEGLKTDYAGFDEPPHRSVFTAVWRGLIDFFGPFWITFTPLGPHAQWMWEEFFVGERDDCGIVQANQDENPYLPADAREAFLKNIKFTDEELLARRAGRFGFLTHRAVPGYDPEVHLIDPFPVPSDWPRILICDPASRRPFFFLWLAWDLMKKDWHAFREFPHDRLHHQYRNSPWSIQDYATIIRNLEGTERIANRVIDPRFGKARFHIKGQEMTSVQEDFARYGLIFDARVPDCKLEETGLQRIREALWYDTNLPLGDFNRPHLYIHRCCKSLDHALSNYSFVPPDIKDDRVLPEKVKEAYKDPIDCLRYGLLSGPPPPSSSHADGYFSLDDLEHENEIDSSWL